MTGRVTRDESGFSLVEMMVTLVMFSLVIPVVGSSIRVIEGGQVQAVDTTQALDQLEVAEQVVTSDIRAANAWTTPALPTQTPSQAVTATSLSFTALLDGATATIAISLDTSSHVLTVTSTSNGVTRTQATVPNIDSSSLFTLTTKEVTTTVNAVTTNSFFYTTVASTLIIDTPAVGAPDASQITLTSPAIVVYNMEDACLSALRATGASGSC